MPSIEERVKQLEVQVRGLLDEMDTVVWFRRTLAETRDNLKTLTEVVNELSVNTTNGFAATRTALTELHTEITELHADMNKGFKRFGDTE